MAAFSTTTMQPTIETIGALERRIDLTVAAAEVELEVAARLAKLARQTTLPGFRRGKVPIKMVAASYGAQVQAEVLNDKVGQALNAALEAQRVRVAGAPRLESRPDAGAGEIAVRATFEVYPEIRHEPVEGLQVRRAVCPLGEAEIDRTIAIMQQQRGVFTPVERGAQAGDRVTLDFAGTVAGVAFEGGTARDFSFVLGRGRMLPAFEEAVAGCTAGTYRRFSMVFPADYGSPAVAGKAAEFDLTVKRVEALSLPAVDAEFARALGIDDGDLGRMRAEVRANLEREVAARLRSRTRESVLQALHQAARFELPRALVEADQRQLAEDARQRMISQGAPASTAAPDAALFAETAQRRVRLGLLLGEIVKANGLKARPEQVRAAVERVAQSYERPQEVVQWYLGDRDRLAEVEASVVEDNAIAWVLERAQATDAPVPFDELMENQR